jgi:putative membrane protein
MNTFLIVGLLSIDPTIRYLRWNKTIKENKTPEISDQEFKRTRIILWLEVIGLAIIMLAAAFMARGIGVN